MKILHLTLKKKWFDLIASGDKKREYRENKPYWQTRLFGKNFDEVHFRNGYSKNSPFMRVECNGIYVEYGSDNPLKKESVFVIVLGNVLEIVNET